MSRFGRQGSRPALSIIDMLHMAIPEPNSGCWLWGMKVNASGYGRVSIKGQQKQAHRVAYELACGPVSPGFEIDHLCRVRCCINPSHLEPVTRLENIRRGTVRVKVVVALAS